MGYVLEEGMRPPFVSEAMANKLLRSGKTLIFLRYASHNRCTSITPRSDIGAGHEQVAGHEAIAWYCYSDCLCRAKAYFTSLQGVLWRCRV